MSRRPPFAPADAQKLAADRYGLEAVAFELPSERDRNFRLEIAGQGADAASRAVLKIADADRVRGWLEAECRVLEHLAETAPELPCPRLFRSRARRLLETVERDGNGYCMRVVSWLPGRPLARVVQRPPLLSDLGRKLGRLDSQLAALDFAVPSRDPDFGWDLARAATLIEQRLAEIDDRDHRRLVENVVERFEQRYGATFRRTRRSLIHNDANDYNLLVAATAQASGCNSKGGADRFAPDEVTGILDFGDMIETHTVADPAIALAYLLLDRDDPVVEAAPFVAGYHQSSALADDELGLLFPLAILRLGLSVATSAHQRRREPDNEYLSITERPAWRALERLADFHPHRAEWIFRAACGLEPCARAARVRRALAHSTPAPLLGFPLTAANTRIVDLGVASPLHTAYGESAEKSPASGEPSATDQLAERVARLLGDDPGGGAPTRVGWSRYDEARPIYRAPQFATASGSARTVHLGVDLAVAAGTAIHSSYPATIHSVADNDLLGDYGPTVILEHRLADPEGREGSDEDAVTVHTLYGHLSRDSIRGLAPGQTLAAGDPIAEVGDRFENGGWWPHLHFQVIVDLVDQVGDFPGVAPPAERAAWRSACPDPNLILRLPAEVLGDKPAEAVGLRARRARTLGRSLSLSYREPLHIVRGEGADLLDADGRRYLDLVNNVCQVGHCHPRVVAAAARQMAVLNTNTRYLHDSILDYAERLLATFPKPLEVCFFVNSGSEANDLALRLARTATGRRGVVCLDAAYHGNLTSLIEISPYKHAGPGGQGSPPWVHVAPLPDVYRGRHRGSDAAQRYADSVADTVRQAAAGSDRVAGSDGVAAFIAESLLGCGGQIELPAGYLDAAYRAVRAAGGVAIADEVQVGFARLGSHFWGFETQGVVPDIVTLGKPIGNGHPLGAVITTRAIADAFANGMEYFNTFGGNPVSCAIGLAVLDVIAEERLQGHARVVGDRLLRGLHRLRERHAFIGDVRGRGLFLGIELVTLGSASDPIPDAALASFVVERLKERRFLLSTDGPDHNVIKIKPPLVIGAEDADRFLEALSITLNEVERAHHQA